MDAPASNPSRPPEQTKIHRMGSALSDPNGVPGGLGQGGKRSNKRRSNLNLCDIFSCSFIFTDVPSQFIINIHTGGILRGYLPL